MRVILVSLSLIIVSVFQIKRSRYSLQSKKKDFKTEAKPDKVYFGHWLNKQPF